MARHTGKNGVANLGSGALVDLRGFDVTETAADVDLTATGDAWDTHDTTTKSWSGSVNLLLNPEDAGQNVRAGDVISFSGATEGDAVGKEQISGTATVTEVGRAHTHNGEVTKSVSLKGKGALAIATIGA